MNQTRKQGLWYHAALAALMVGLASPPVGAQGMGGMGGGMYGPGAGFDCPYGSWGGGAQSGGMMGPMMGWGPGDAAGRFSLNDEQRKKLQTLNEHVWRRQQELSRQMLEQHTRLQQLQLADQADADEILKTHKAISELRLQMLEARLRAGQDFEKGLNAEQRQYWRHMQGWGAGRW